MSAAESHASLDGPGTSKHGWSRLVVVNGPRALLAALILGVAIRLIAVGAFGTDKQNLYEFGVIGQNVVDGRGYSFYSVGDDRVVSVDNSHQGRPLPSGFMPPGYTYTVATAQGLGTSRSSALLILQLFNVVVAATTIVLAYLLGSLLFGLRAGTWSAFAFALYPVLIFQATQPSASNAYLPLDLAALLLAIRLSRRPSLARAVAGGAAIGLVCLFRAEAVLWIPSIAVWLVWSVGRQAPNGRLGGRRTVVVIGAFLIAGCAVPFAWMLRNTVTLGALTPSITTTSGFNLWIGNHDGASGSQKRFTREDARLQAGIHRLRPTPNYELDRDHLYLDAALSSMAAQPVTTVERDLKKLAMTLSFDFYDPRARNPAYLGSWLLLASLGLYGITRRLGAREDRVFLYGYVIVGLLIPTIFFTLARYKLALEAPLLLFSGAAAAAVVERRADPSRRPVRSDGP